MRHFIRHPVDIPIEVSADEQSLHALPHACNVSVGGLAIQSDVELKPGAIIDIRIPFVRPMFETKARVVWCHDHEQNFDLGVEFLDPEDAFRARMVEQVCHIEKYKQDMHREGRYITPEEAAMEWIDKYAWRFPGNY
ncbi:MAG: PilZ domain-containing protein [Rhodospirillales bacterium]|nr:PilZ domain-containing protein [Rhodospirillales bacterium]